MAVDNKSQLRSFTGKPLGHGPWWLLLCLLLLAVPQLGRGAVISQLPGHDKRIALTFDACETKTPSFLDEKIISFLVTERIPFTIFVSGKFARRNGEALRSLASTGLVELENHSRSHVQHMERLSDEAIVREVRECEELVTGIAGRRPLFFRFPAGNYDQHSLHLVENLGYQVVHWSFASGDPDKQLSPQRLSAGVLARVRPGNILIFHVNGRGYSTGAALPQIVAELRSRGMQFVRLDSGLSAAGNTP